MIDKILRKIDKVLGWIFMNEVLITDILYFIMALNILTYVFCHAYINWPIICIVLYNIVWIYVAYQLGIWNEDE